jgi:hypothetical protein
MKVCGKDYNAVTNDYYEAAFKELMNKREQYWASAMAATRDYRDCIEFTDKNYAGWAEGQALDEAYDKAREHFMEVSGKPQIEIFQYYVNVTLQKLLGKKVKKSRK